MRLRPLNKWETTRKPEWERKGRGLATRGKTHFPSARERENYLDEAERGKHIHEETAPWVFEGSARKEAHDPTVQFLQTAHPRSEALPWPGGSCLYHRQLMLPSADFQALGSHDCALSLPWLLTANPLPLLTQDKRYWCRLKAPNLQTPGRVRTVYSRSPGRQLGTGQAYPTSDRGTGEGALQTPTQ